MNTVPFPTMLSSEISAWPTAQLAARERIGYYDPRVREYVCQLAPAATPWYPIGKHEVFPEQFEKFLLGNEKIQHHFLKHHAPLLTRAYWQSHKERILAGVVDDVFPYLQIRFCKHAAGATPAAGTPSYFGELLS
jgi:isocitrate dehydrogenase kinase/phosphatase